MAELNLGAISAEHLDVAYQNFIDVLQAESSSPCGDAKLVAALHSFCVSSLYMCMSYESTPKKNYSSLEDLCDDFVLSHKQVQPTDDFVRVISFVAKYRDIMDDVGRVSLSDSGWHNLSATAVFNSMLVLLRAISGIVLDPVIV